MIEIDRITNIGKKYIASEFLLGRRESDGRKVKEILPAGITAVEAQTVRLDREIYHTVIGSTPGTEGNWAVSVSRRTFEDLVSQRNG